jgi:hypothetical protein
MLTRKKILNHMHGKLLTLVLSVSFGFAILALFLTGKVMAWECENCDNCTTILEFYYECFHTDPVSPDCDMNKCMVNVLETATCQPNQGEDAEGCDVQQQARPGVPSGYPESQVWVYEMTDPIEQPCVTLSSGYEVWRRTYYGCDPPEDPYNANCSERKHNAACHTTICSGQGPTLLIEIKDRYPARMQCGCD